MRREKGGEESLLAVDINDNVPMGRAHFFAPFHPITAEREMST